MTPPPAVDVALSCPKLEFTDVDRQNKSSTVPPWTVQAFLLHQDRCEHVKLGVMQDGFGTRVETISSCGAQKLMVLVPDLVVISGPIAYVYPLTTFRL